MIRTFGTALVLLTYLLSTLQVVVHVHDCDLSGWEVQLFEPIPANCCEAAVPALPVARPACCHEEVSSCHQPSSADKPSSRQQTQSSPDDCCQDAEITFSVAEPQQVANPLSLPAMLASANRSQAAMELQAETVSQPFAFRIDPPPQKVHLWRLHCVDLVYG